MVAPDVVALAPTGRDLAERTVAGGAAVQGILRRSV